MKLHTKLFGMVAGAAAFAMLMAAPMTAEAVVFSPSNNIADGDTVDIASGPYFFQADFTGADNAGTFTFTFQNNSTTDIVGAVSIATVLQGVTAAVGQFTGGVDFSFGADTASVAQGASASMTLFTLIAANGGTEDLVIAFGDPVGLKADIDFNVSQVPLPASALLFISALGGLGFVGRRRKSAA